MVATIRPVFVFLLHGLFITSPVLALKLPAREAPGGAQRHQHGKTSDTIWDRFLHGLGAVNQSLTSESGRRLQIELFEALLSASSNKSNFSDVDGMAQAVMDAGKVALYQAGLVEDTKTGHGVIRMHRGKHNQSDPAATTSTTATGTTPAGWSIFLGVDVPMLTPLMHIPFFGFNSGPRTHILKPAIAWDMSWFLNVNFEPYSVRPCVSSSAHAVWGSFEAREFGGVDAIVGAGLTENVPGMSWSLDVNPSIAERLLVNCFKSKFYEIESQHVGILLGHLEKEVMPHDTDKWLYFFKDKIGPFSKGDIIEKIVQPGIRELSETFGCPNEEVGSGYGPGQLIDIPSIMETGRVPSGIGNICIRIILSKPDCNWGYRKLVSFVAQSSLGLELTYVPIAFVQIALSTCLYGTTQGGLCGMNEEQVRDEALKDAAFPQEDMEGLKEKEYLDRRYGYGHHEMSEEVQKQYKAATQKVHGKWPKLSEVATIDLAPFAVTWCSAEPLLWDWSEASDPPHKIQDAAGWTMGAMMASSMAGLSPKR